ncbi:MAG TPA: hypothetical protein VJN96_25385 [Vicinamibacterales bacterium]|nr:hypothetical protein [Vicinamibacterales bacterium]
MTRLLLVAGAVLVAVSAAGAQQPQALDPQGTVALVVTYADGRRQTMLVGPLSVGCASTQTFVRVQGWTPPPGQLPVRAIKFSCTRTYEGMRVRVSVFRGAEQEKDEAVATVSVTPGQAVAVDALRTVGVEPITLTLTAVTVPEAALPQVTLLSSELEVVSLTMVEKPVPRYRLFLVNHSAKAVRSLEVMLTRGGRPATSTNARDDEGQVLMEPGGRVGLQLQVPTGRPDSSGTVAMAPADGIVITGLLWADNSFEGDASYARDQAAYYYGQRLQLARVIAELERARDAGPGATVAGLRAALSNLSVEVTAANLDEARQALAPNITLAPVEALHTINLSLSQIKKLALSDLADFESGPPLAGAFQAWLKTEGERLQRWHDRLAMR